MAERTIGPYRVIRRVGDRGGMATVYLAYQPSLDRHVALKELDLRSEDHRVADRFLAESRIASALRHPNIVAVHDFFEWEGVPYISMEYVERGSLRRYVGTLTMAQTFGVLEGVLAGLAHAHNAGVVHRDLKPENLLVTADGAVKIADFGIAKAIGRVTNLTETGLTVGTPAYMAPEQALGEPVSPATDLHALGVVAYQLFSGTLPFEETEAPMALLYRKVNEPYPRLPDADPLLEGLVAQLLARSPAERPQSAHEVWDAFEEIAVVLLGPLWRREARLEEPGASSEGSPLTPAPFLDDGASETDGRLAPSMPHDALVEAPRAPEEPVRAGGRRRRRHTVLAAAGLGAAVVVAVVSVIGASKDPPPAPTSTPAPALTPTDPDAARLLSYVQSRLGPRGRCDVDDRGLPRKANARVRCTLPGSFPAVFTRFDDRRALRAYFDALRRHGRPVNLGRCAANGEWWKADTPKKVEGKLIGRRAGGRLVLTWTDDDDRLAAFARTTPKAAAKLCSAWEKYA